MFWAHHAHHQERQSVSIQYMSFCVGDCVVCGLEVYFRPARDMATDTEWQLPEVVLTQFVSPDDEHDVLETWRDLKIKINTQKGIVCHVGHLPRRLFESLLRKFKFD